MTACVLFLDAVFPFFETKVSDMHSFVVLFIHFSPCVLTHNPACGLEPGLLSGEWKPEQAVGVSHWAGMPGGTAYSLMMLL